MIASGADENNHGPANIGQAKHMAKSALDTLRPILPDVAAQIEADLAPILSFSVPDPKTPEWIEKQKVPLLIGQLKAIAAPFYTRLNAAAPAWLENQRNTSGTSSPNSIFPWTEGVGDDQNKAIANIGQLKAVFSLDLDKLPTDLQTLDTDGDGLPDRWELTNRIDPLDNGSGNIQNGANGSFTAPDGSVITNAQALAQGLGGGGENQLIPKGSASFAAITFPESEVTGVSQVFPIAVNNDASVLLVSELGKKPRALRWNAGNTEELLFSKQELFDEYFDAEDGQWPEFPRPVDLNNQGVVLATPTWAFLDKEEDDEEGFWINDFVHWPPPPATISVSIPMIVNLPASSLLEKELPGLRLLGSVLNDGSEYLLTNLDDQGSYFFLAPSMHYQSNLVFDVDYEGNKSYPSIQVGTTFKVGITESAGSSSIPLLAQIGTRHHVQDSEGRQTISGIIKQVLATSPDGTKRVIISEDSENPRTPPSVGPTSTLTLEGGGADLTDFPKVHKDLYSVNNAGVLIGSTGADTRVSNGTDQFTLPGLPVAISSPSDTTTPLVILTQTHYYSQKKNPESGDLLPADKAANFDATPFKKLPTLAAWTDVTLTDMSDDGSLIVGHGNLHNLDAEGNRTEPPIGKRGFLLLPVEVIIPKLDSGGNQIDGEFVGATELKVAKWEDAFEGTGANGSVKDDFIGWDKDRFYVRIPGAASMGIEAVKVATEDCPDASYNDDATRIELTAGGSDSISDSMILVSDDEDDDYAGSGAGADDQDDDRTHKVQLGGKLVIKSIFINGTEHEVNMKIPVPVRKVLPVDFIRMNVANVHDLTEIERSAKIANERYAQVGIKVNVNIIDKEWPVLSPDRGDGILRLFSGDSLVDGHLVGPMTDEYKSFIDQTDASGINIYFLTSAYGTSKGIALTAAQLEFESGEIDNKYFDKAFVNFAAGQLAGDTPAHELGHLLAYKTDDADRDDHNEPYFNLMNTTPRNNVGVFSRKRFNESQQSRMYQHSMLTNP